MTHEYCQTYCILEPGCKRDLDKCIFFSYLTKEIRDEDLSKLQKAGRLGILARVCEDYQNGIELFNKLTGQKLTEKI